MRFLLNILPFILLAYLVLCGVGVYSLGWKISTAIPCSAAAICSFICSLSWRATPEGPAGKLNGVIFLIAAVLSVLLVMDSSLIRLLWLPMTISVFASIHVYLFEVARKSVIFSGGRTILLMLPIVVNVIVIAGLFLWNGSIAFATIGFIAAVIFALLSTLFGYKKAISPEHRED